MMIRKINKNTVISFSLIFLLVFSFLCLCFFDKNINRVSAANNHYVSQDGFSVAQFNNPLNLDTDFLRQLDDSIYLNTSLGSMGYTKSNSFWVLAQDSGTYYLQVIKTSPCVICGTYTISYNYTTLVSFSTVGFISSYVFSNNGFWSTAQTYFTVSNVFYLDGRNYVIGSYENQGNGWDAVLTNFTPRFTDIVCVRDYNFPYDPILTPILDYPYNLDIQSQSFTEWLISTNKYKEINRAMLSNHVNQYVELFNQYGASLSFFKKQVSAFFDFYNIGQGISDYNVILNKTRQLYQEYMRLKNDTVGNHLAPRVESSIVPETNDNNLTLVTNDSNDTEIISILRDILRSLLSFPSTWNDLNQLLLNAFNSLDLTTNIVNDGGAGLTSADIWGSGDITESQNYQSLSAAFMDKGVDVVSAESMDINYLDGATQQDSFTVSVVMPAQFVNGEFTEKTITHTIDNTSKMFNTLLLFRKLIAFAVISYFAIRIRFELPHLIRGE